MHVLVARGEEPEERTYTNNTPLHYPALAILGYNITTPWEKHNFGVQHHNTLGKAQFSPPGTKDAELGSPRRSLKNWTTPSPHQYQLHYSLAPSVSAGLLPRPIRVSWTTPSLHPCQLDYSLAPSVSTGLPYCS
eukprot:gene9888-biopygen22764